MPIFGYDTIGSLISSAVERICGSQYTCPEAGTAQSITVALGGASSSYQTHVKCAIYKASDLSAPITNGETEEKLITITSNYQWFTFNFPNPPSLEANTDYVLCVWTESGTGRVARDDDASVNRWWESHVYADEWPSLSPSDRTGKFSIYCTYTAGATEITVTDSVSLSDSVLRHKTLTINDSIDASDSILGHKTFSIADAIQLLEQILRDKSFTLSDQIDVSDQIISDKSLTISDTITLSDLVNVISEILKTVTDSIGLSDQVLTHKTFTVSDQITLSDQALRGKLVEISDQISLLESIIASKLFVIIDQIGLTDAVQIVQIIKVVKDSVSLLDQILTHKHLTIQDQVTLTEAVRVLGVLAKLIKILIESFIPIKIETGNLSYFDPSSFDKDDFIADEPFIPLKITSESFIPIKIETGNLSYFDPSSFDKDDFIADEPFIPLKITSESFIPIKIECEEVIE